MRAFKNFIYGVCLYLFTALNMAPPPQEKTPLKQRQLKKILRQYRSKNLSDLLDNIDAVFELYNYPELYNETDQDLVVALKKIGLHIPSKDISRWDCPNPDYLKTIHIADIPAIMFLGFDHGKARKKNLPNGWLEARFVYAQKFTRKPWDCESKRGAAYYYEIGFTVADWEYKKTNWLTGYLAVFPDGTLKACRQLKQRYVSISPYDGYVKKTYAQGTAFEDDVHLKKGEREAAILSMFIHMTYWWMNQKNNWQVAVKKNGRRVIFEIDKANTKEYFADRQKMISLSHGKTKRIIHYVHAFARKNGQYVKDHLRGLSEFNWKGYECKVIAPEFRGFIDANMTIGAELLKEDELPTNINYVHPSKIALKQMRLQESHLDQRYYDQKWLDKKNAEVLVEKSKI